MLSFAASLGLFILGSSDPITRLGNLTAWSFGIFMCTLIIAGASVAAAISLWLARSHQIRRSVRWFSTIVTAALLIAIAYLTYWGAIGIRLWA